MFYEAILAGIIIGLLTSGKLSNLASINLKSISLVFLSFVLKYSLNYLASKGMHLSLAVLMSLHATVYLLLFYFLFLNRQIPGIKILFIGFFLNFLVIMANQGAMPVKITNSLIIGNIQQQKIITHSLFSPDTRLPFLADIYVNYYPKEIFSIGDIFICVGVFYLIWASMRIKDIKTYRMDSFISRVRL
jgi:hypothetical protein